jgi:transposase InsO family protein
VAKRLVEKGRELKMKDVATILNISERTLRTWKSQYVKDEFPKMGRPTHDVQTRIKTAKIVREEWLAQGKPGWRAVKAAHPKTSTVLIQRYVNDLKRKDRARHWKYQREDQKRMGVNYPAVIWTQDATYLDKKSSRKYAEIIKDRCTQEVIEARGTISLSNKATLKLLEKENLPLVYMSDNGSAYVSEEVSRYLAKRRVIHLKSLPRTPQHNGAAEVLVREVKRLYRDCENERMSDQERLDLSKEILNKRRLWASLNYRTVESFVNECKKINVEEIREELYEQYRLGVLSINEKVTSRKKRRVLERELVFNLLEKYNLIRWRKGGMSCG